LLAFLVIPMLRNTPQSWGSVSKTFHWLIAALIVVQVPAGYLMSYTYGLATHDSAVQPLQDLASQFHHTIGLLILVLVPARLAWRFSGPVPGGVGESLPRVRLLARVCHGLLYALLMVLALSGWAAVSVVAGAPIWLFGARDVVPRILPAEPAQAWLGYWLFGHIHIYAVWLGAGVLAAHAGAAVWHLAVVKDGVFRRMWPLG